MRSQIARLERQLALLAFELGMAGRSVPVTATLAAASDGSPRLLALGELEAARDELAFAVRGAQRTLERRLEDEALARGHLGEMLADPGAHRFERLERAQLGEPGCGAYEVRPRFGLLGMMFGWWCVKLSSGCP